MARSGRKILDKTTWYSGFSMVASWSKSVGIDSVLAREVCGRFLAAISTALRIAIKGPHGSSSLRAAT